MSPSASSSRSIAASAQSDFNPLYRQIRQHLENQMLLGDLPLGARVPTEQELCKRHGVSRITARRALEDLREEGVIERVQGRGSFVKKLPKGGASSAPTEVGVLTAGGADFSLLKESWWGQIIQGLSNNLSREGFHLTLLPFSLDGGSNEKLWERVDGLGPRLAGVLGAAAPGILPVFEGFEQRGIPWVSVNPVLREQTHNFVSANHFAGGHRVAREFVQLGCRTALFVSTSVRYFTNADRFFGFMQGWVESGQQLEGVSLLEVAGSDGLSELEFTRLVKLLSGKNRPRAVLCTGDLLASVVLKACHQCGLAVPGDVAVVGGTGTVLAEHMTPTLTVLAQPMMEIGRAAEAMLVEMIRTKRLRVPGRYVPGPLIRRESCPIGDLL